METTYLVLRAISSASNRGKIFYLSSVLFELSDFEDKVIKISKFLTFFENNFVGFSFTVF